MYSLQPDQSVEWKKFKLRVMLSLSIFTTQGKISLNTTSQIKLTKLDPVINLNNLEEQNFYFPEAMKRKQRWIYYGSNIALYLSLMGIVKWDKITEFKTASDGFFLAFSLMHLLTSSSIFFTYYNTYRNLMLYGANGIMLLMILIALINYNDKDDMAHLRSATFFYISVILCSAINSILLVLYSRKVYSINIKEIIEELQEEKTSVNNNMILLV